MVILFSFPLGGGWQAGKYVRITMNVAMICQTIIEPPANGGDITRDNITCKIIYTADGRQPFHCFLLPVCCCCFFVVVVVFLNSFVCYFSKLEHITHHKAKNQSTVKTNYCEHACTHGHTCTHTHTCTQSH